MHDTASIDYVAEQVARMLNDVEEEDRIRGLDEWERGYAAALRRVEQWLSSSCAPSIT